MTSLDANATPEAPQTTGRWRRRTAITVATAVSVVLITGVAYAYWSATGTGTSTIGSTSAIPLGVTSLTTPLTDLYPGKIDDVGFKLSNTNPYPVSITKLTAVSVASSDAVNCPTTNVTLSATVMAAVAAGGYTLPAAVNVPAGSTTTTGSITGLLQLNATAPDGCQAKTFTLSLTFTGTQV